ncbi:hypothetical protein CDD81_2887 [Ophiocordyceps australis]|uniref:Cupin type-1 domain-containing protein n=1 Tax=Ophiocordyceps australis TaxID=1399860 RepID=A0A2C5XQH1_9HYPO|nr:hypothetical protein CDD81_2887 [Ophiocordyceps australis]
MSRPRLLGLALLLLCNLRLECTAMAASENKYTITAISAVNGKSVIECWELDAPCQASAAPGTSGAASTQLGPVGNVTHTVLAPNFDGGWHNAPAAQYVVFISGRAEITVPDWPEKLVVEGGENGIIIAADTADVSRRGHRTVYPSNVTTTALQLPFQDGQIPPHKVLYSGPCRKDRTC